MKDNRTDKEVLEDCIKSASYTVSVTNNVNTRMILTALIEKQIRDEEKSLEGNNEINPMYKSRL